MSIEQIKNWLEIISLVGGLVTLIIGLIVLYRYISGLRKKIFKSPSQKMAHDLEKRRSISDPLAQYVRDGSRYICFEYCKNYPYVKKDDSFRHSLRVKGGEDHLHGYIDKTGVNFIETDWFHRSVYLDKGGIFFYAPKNKIFKNFREIPDISTVRLLPFRNIVKYDFRKHEMDEPVFYTRYKYDNWKKLYDDKLEICHRGGARNLVFICELKQRNWMRRYSRLKYLWYKFKLWPKGETVEIFSRLPPPDKGKE
ncbi:MAG: hypothetical protein MPJ79_00565 [Alphaproteobacteria bacterium]|nr:hypothetical protein [Alphaproteobacteria bacterium]MDA7988128.1 hypothetical protein [Alphaproteobacteria bacterium]MDA8031527.1 hypothetical protein [Alphaproteobacteria bacterium]